MTLCGAGSWLVGMHRMKITFDVAFTLCAITFGTQSKIASRMNPLIMMMNFFPIVIHPNTVPSPLATALSAFHIRSCSAKILVRLLMGPSVE